MLWPCALTPRALRRQQKRGISHSFLDVIVVLVMGGVFRLKVREKAFRINFHPVWKLHAPSATLKKNPILMVWSEDDGMCRAGSVLAEDIYKHPILGLEQELRGKFGITGFIPYCSIGDSRVIRGFNSYDSPKKSVVLTINSLEHRWGQCKGIKTIY